ncbi:MAG TPA: helix-turn-helix domain-containing protein, partial [Myxococcota bacterium]|nr:helix-turn-helix domain-containing protein [Myxococcota bacterium]
MIDHETGGRSAAGEASALDPAQTFEDRPIGEYLRRQRLLRGMSTEELAALTRIPLRSLERLESGHFDGETDGFVRGFVRTVATALGLDADD